MNWLSNLLPTLRTWFLGLTPARRAITVVVTLALLAIFSYVGYTSSYSTSGYRPLYSGLTHEEAGKLKTILDGKSIPNRLDGDGTIVSVPAEKFALAKVEVAVQGVPLSGGKGWEIFDDSPLGMTPFQQQVNYNRALQAELSRSITQLEPIAHARVHIVRPEPTPFVREQKPTSASVLLRLKPRAQLTPDKAQGIVAMICRAVEGLQPEHVTLLDTAGRLLSDARRPEEKGTQIQLEARQQYENNLAAQAESLLRQHLGHNRVHIRVSADVNLERIKERSELFNPDAKVGTSERISTLKTVGASGGPRGVAGTKSNVSGGNTATAGAGGGGTSVQEKTDTDYAVSRTLRELEKRNNIIERMTVAALLDLSGQGENTPKLTLADATKLIKSAIGFKEGRDDIQVSDVRLLSEQEGPEVDPAVQERMESLLFAIRTASLVVGLLLLVLLAILVASRKRREKKAKLEAAAQVPPAPPILPQEADEFRNLVQADPERVARMLTQLLEGTS